MYGGTKFLTILIFLQLSETPFAEQNQQCVPSSCGHIHNISYPFRLKSDPKRCGRENYELSCEGTRTILYGDDQSDYYVVQAINYDNSTIRLVDPDIREQVLCSLPQHSRSKYSLSFFGFTTWRSYASNVSSDLFKGHTYATMAKFSASELKVGCSIFRGIQRIIIPSWLCIMLWHMGLSFHGFVTFTVRSATGVITTVKVKIQGMFVVWISSAKITILDSSKSGVLLKDMFSAFLQASSHGYFP